jgi:hypothetical protein
MIECTMNLKECGRKRSLPNLRYCLFWNLPGGIEENHEKTQSDSQCPGRSNWAPPEYKSKPF